MWKEIVKSIGSELFMVMNFESIDAEEINQCKHCGQNFYVEESDGWNLGREIHTCNWCYQDGKRDAETYEYDGNTN